MGFTSRYHQWLEVRVCVHTKLLPELLTPNFNKLLKKNFKETQSEDEKKQAVHKGRYPDFCSTWVQPDFNLTHVMEAVQEILGYQD